MFSNERNKKIYGAVSIELSSFCPPKIYLSLHVKFKLAGTEMVPLPRTGITFVFRNRTGRTGTEMVPVPRTRRTIVPRNIRGSNIMNTFTQKVKQYKLIS